MEESGTRDQVAGHVLLFQSQTALVMISYCHQELYWDKHRGLKPCIQQIQNP